MGQIEKNLCEIDHKMCSLLGQNGHRQNPDHTN